MINTLVQHRIAPTLLLHFLTVYIYIYTYIHTCVCRVCVFTSPVETPVGGYTCRRLHKLPKIAIRIHHLGTKSAFPLVQEYVDLLKCPKEETAETADGDLWPWNWIKGYQEGLELDWWGSLESKEWKVVSKSKRGHYMSLWNQRSRLRPSKLTKLVEVCLKHTQHKSQRLWECMCSLCALVSGSVCISIISMAFGRVSSATSRDL